MNELIGYLIFWTMVIAELSAFFYKEPERVENAPYGLQPVNRRIVEAIAQGRL